LNPKYYRLTYSVDIVGIANSGGNSMKMLFIYQVGGVTQQLVTTFPDASHLMTYPDNQGVVAQLQAGQAQLFGNFIFALPPGLGSAAMGNISSGARLSVALVYGAADTWGSMTMDLDIMIQEAVFRPWEWDDGRLSSSAVQQSHLTPFSYSLRLMKQKPAAKQLQVVDIEESHEHKCDSDHCEVCFQKLAENTDFVRSMLAMARRQIVVEPESPVSVTPPLMVTLPRRPAAGAA